MNKSITLLTLVCFTTLFACDSNTKTTPTNTPKAKTATPKVTPKANKTTTNATKTLTIPANGKELKPPAQKAQIPDGAYMCDMGTVHYARMTPGDGKCPLCGMALIKKGATTSNKINHQHKTHKH